jgi:hypothetical protein
MLRTLEGEPVPRRGEAWVVTERSTYVLLAPATATVRLGPRALAWSGTHGGWLVPVSWWTAEQVLHVRDPDGERRLPLLAQPNADKLRGDEWAALLADLDGWLPAVTGGEEGGEHGGHSIAGIPLPALAAALAGTARALLDAVAGLLERPRLAHRIAEEQRRLHTVRRADAAVVRWLGRHPAAARQLDWDAEERDADPFVRVPAVEAHLDHPANRFLAGQLRRVVATLTRAGDSLLARRPREGELTDAVDWAHARGARCHAAADALARRVRASWLGAVPAGEATAAALAVLHGDPVYRRVHRYCDALLRPRWDAAAAAALPVRPTYTLYELWVFLWLARAMEPAAGRGRWHRLERLQTRTGAGAAWRAPGVRLVFNQPFPGWPPPDPDRPHSLTGPRRPDLALTLETAAGPAWFALDAKYRVGRAALMDAFTSAHVYRDALRWPKYGGAPRGVLLVCPRPGEDTAPWFDPAFHARWGIGAVVARPGAGPPTLPDLLREHVQA